MTAARRIFVGDIQGCLEPLEMLLDAVGFVPGCDRLFPTGDLVNKGPDSLGVLRRLRALEAASVLGNHDLMWLRTGRIADPELHAWLAAQPLVRLFDDVILVHAGLHPAWTDTDLVRLAACDPLAGGAEVDFAVTVRYCTRDGELPAVDWPPPPEPYRPWDAWYTGTRRVVFGHWARRGLDHRARITALDSGCVYGKTLSAWIAEDDRIVQVPGLARGTFGR